jgi:hypothetical protein
MDLETTLLEEKCRIASPEKPSLKERMKHSLALYATDVISGWAYYTPTYGLQEAIAGKSIDKIVRNRLLGLAAVAIAMYPIRLVADCVGKKMNISEESPFIDKWKHRFISITPIQSIVYGGILAGEMAWSNNYDLHATRNAWILGTCLSAIHSFPYGWAQKKFRQAWGFSKEERTDFAPPEKYTNITELLDTAIPEEYLTTSTIPKNPEAYASIARRESWTHTDLSTKSTTSPAPTARDLSQTKEL